MSRWRLLSSKWAAAVAGFLALVLLGVVSVPQPDLTIAVNQGLEGGPMKAVTAQFCQDRYQGKVKVVDLPYDELFAAEWSAVTGKDAGYPFTTPPRFDVIMLDDPWLPTFVEAQGLLALDHPERLAGEGGLGDFPEPCQRVCRYPPEGQVYYALPFTGNSQLFCRVKKDVPEQPGKWDEVLQAKWREQDELPYAMRLGPGNSVVTDFFSIVWRYAPKSFTGNDYWTLSREEAGDALKMFRSLAADQHWTSAVTEDVDVAVSIALDAAPTGVVWSSWAMALERHRDQIEATAGSLEYDWFPGQKPVLGAWLLAVPRNAPHPKQAREFIQYAIGKEQLKRAAEYGNPPPRVSLLSELGKDYRTFPAQLKSLNNAQPRPRTPCWRELEQRLSRALVEVGPADQVGKRLIDDLQGLKGRDVLDGCGVRH
jgi:multiple sugar transport system substrate-binding protein